MATALMTKRAARKSDDYVEEIIRRRGGDGNAPRLTHEAKMQKLELVLQDEINGIQRLGVGMIGPIQLKLRYQGMVRNVLMEDPVTPGTDVSYDVMDDLGQAYKLNPTDGEVRITMFEGKRIRIDFFRIASFPVVRKEDLLQLKINIVEQAQDETRQAIMKDEDAFLISLLDAAVTDYATRPDHDVSPNHAVTEASGYFTAQSLYTAVAISDEHEVESARILVNPVDWRDFFRWDINTTGWAYKDRQVAGEKIMSFGEFQIQKSTMVTKGKMYLLPEPNFLGWFPVLYSLDVEENHNVEAFHRGWVFDEMVSMAVVNPRGIVTISK